MSTNNSLNANESTPFSVTYGGTDVSNPSAYRLIAGGITASGAFQSVVAGSAGQLLQSNGASALPTWTASTFPVGPGTLNHLLRSDGTNWVETTATTIDASDNMAGLTSVSSVSVTVSDELWVQNVGSGYTGIDQTTSGLLLTSGDMTTTNKYTAPILFGSTDPDFTTSNPKTLAAIAGASWIQNYDSDTKGRMDIVFLGTPNDPGTAPTLSPIARMTIGVVNESLLLMLGRTGGVGAIALSEDLSNGTNIIEILAPSNIPTNYDLYLPSAQGAAGQTLINDGSGNLSWGTSSILWSTIAGTTQAAGVDNGYIIGNASQTTVTLPATAAIGSTVQLMGSPTGTAGWVLAANTGQTIKIGSSTTSSAGSLTSAGQLDNVTVVCIVANLTWMVSTVSSAGLTIA